MSIDGKRVVVTGGRGAIGAIVVREFLSLSADVLVVDREAAPTVPTRYIRGDLSNGYGIAHVAMAIAAFQPDILINLAGLQYFGALEQQRADDVEAGYMVNLVAPVQLSRAVLALMKDRGSGQIVNIGSIFGSISYPHFATYSSAKAGLRGFSEALRRELHGSGIDVTYIAPRAVRTGLNSGLVLRFAEMANMTMDQPECVACRIVQAIVARKKDVYIGAREGVFVRLNALLPRFVDAAIARQTARARNLFSS